jgi:hypothetical protein
VARTQVGNRLGVTAVAGVNINGGDDAGAGQDLDNADTITALRTRLTAISATTYSAAELDKMTENDMIYALRVLDAASTVK